jgi:hypothetical protein
LFGKLNGFNAVKEKKPSFLFLEMDVLSSGLFVRALNYKIYTSLSVRPTPTIRMCTLELMSRRKMVPCPSSTRVVYLLISLRVKA